MALTIDKDFLRQQGVITNWEQAATLPKGKVAAWQIYGQLAGFLSMTPLNIAAPFSSASNIFILLASA